ncbi:hypothetical protein CP8484711_1307A, partial [Chlamydia psittaci 84-8471/1]
MNALYTQSEASSSTSTA